MEEQLVTVTIRTCGEKCVMTDGQIREWYESHVRELYGDHGGSGAASRTVL